MAAFANSMQDAVLYDNVATTDMPNFARVLDRRFLRDFPIRAVVSATLFVSATEATAQESPGDNSANSVFSGCKAFVEGRTTSSKLHAEGNFCSGAVHALAGVGKYLSPPEWQSCVPANSTAGQLARVVINYIEARPQRMHEDFRLLTLEAFHYAWPCKSRP